MLRTLGEFFKNSSHSVQVVDKIVTEPVPRLTSESISFGIALSSVPDRSQTLWDPSNTKVQDIERQRLVQGFHVTSVLYKWNMRLFSALLLFDRWFFNCMTIPKFHY